MAGITRTAPGTRTRADAAEVLERALETGRAIDFTGYSKHDGLNARWLEVLAGTSRIRRLVAIQAVMRAPFNVRPLVRVRPARNPKGLSLFSRALLSRFRRAGDERDAAEARALLDWLVANPSPGFEWKCWGYPYPWQDVGFFAPRHLPNRVVTSFVVQALLDGYEILGEPRYLEAAQDAVRFLLTAPKTMYEDEAHRCVSYVPDPAIDWIVMDVSALSGAAAARLGALTKEQDLITEGGRLVRYVVSKQTDEGAWFYAEPPSASHITHDNYHTGFILDAIDEYMRSAGTDEFRDAYDSGIEFYRRRLFEPDGAARFMNDRLYPIDIHGCAQGVITFSLQQQRHGSGGEVAGLVLDWTLANMWDPDSGWFYYQKRARYRTAVRELRWCQAWMSWALACYLETTGV